MVIKIVGSDDRAGFPLTGRVLSNDFLEGKDDVIAGQPFPIMESCVAFQVEGVLASILRNLPGAGQAWRDVAGMVRLDEGVEDQVHGLGFIVKV